MYWPEFWHTYLLTYLINITFYCVLLSFTYNDDEWLEESKNLLRDGMPQSCENASAKSSHFEIEDGEDGAENAANDADQQRRSEHYHVHWDRASQLHTQHRTSYSSRLLVYRIDNTAS